MVKNDEVTQMKQFIQALETSYSRDQLLAAQQSLSTSTTTEQTQTCQFAVAKLLVSSPDDNEVKEGLDYMAQLCRSSEYLLDALFYRAIGHYRLGEYSQCKRHLSELITVDPLHEKGAQFLEFYKANIRHEGKIGFLIACGAAFIVSAVAVWAFRRRINSTQEIHSTSYQPYNLRGHYGYGNTLPGRTDHPGYGYRR